MRHSNVDKSHCFISLASGGDATRPIQFVTPTGENEREHCMYCFFMLGRNDGRMGEQESCESCLMANRPNPLLSVGCHGGCTGSRDQKPVSHDCCYFVCVGFFLKVDLLSMAAHDGNHRPVCVAGESRSKRHSSCGTKQLRMTTAWQAARSTLITSGI